MKCDTKFQIGECSGVHLGKFSSCLDEAVWGMALDDARSSGGDPDYGYASLVVVADGDPDSSERFEFGGELFPGGTCVVPGGWYLVYGETSGAVSVAKADSEEHANEVWNLWLEAFLKWSEANGD